VVVSAASRRIAEQYAWRCLHRNSEVEQHCRKRSSEVWADLGREKDSRLELSYREMQGAPIKADQAEKEPVERRANHEAASWRS